MSNPLSSSFSIPRQQSGRTSLGRIGALASRGSYRVFEFVVALVALLISVPVMLVIAVMIRRDTPGPILFKQQRIDRGCRPFTFVKFRTHYVDAKERFREWSHYQFTEEELPNVRLQVQDDPRVTPVGRWLRQTSLDELPNFVHVLIGHVALVGPRPEMWIMLPYYKGEMLDKFSVKPGITGYAQIYGRGNLTFAETLAYDLRYVRERSVALDLKILWLTAWVVTVGESEGAY